MKQLTIKQMNDLIEKNKKLKADLSEANKRNEELSGEGTLEKTLNDKKVVENDMRDLQRRLGSKDYCQLVDSNIEQILENMEDDTKDIFDQLVEMKFTDRESIKVSLGLIQKTAPGAKFAFIKTLLAMESASIRSTSFVALSKLVEADRMKSGFVKEVLDRDDNEKTPSSKTFDDPKVPEKPLKITIPDPASVDKDVSRYNTESNKNCRVVRVKETCFLAFSSDSQYLTKHQPFIDVHGRKVKKNCLGCNNEFVEAETEIGPVIVVGPDYHGKLGEQTWVCREHWEKSVTNEVEEDKVCEVAAIQEEALEYLERSPVVTSKTSKLKLRKRLNFSGGKKDSGMTGVKVLKLKKTLKEKKDDDVATSGAGSETDAE